MENMRQLLAYDAIAYGMGMGESEEVAKGAVWLLSNYEGRLVLDADALNSLACYEKENLAVLFKTKKCDVLLTPHGKEFSRLFGGSVEEIYKNSLAIVKDCAGAFAVNILLKNAVSILSNGEGTAINVAGCSGQAKAGSGDVLSGLIAGLCAMGISTYEGGLLGAYLAGKSAEFAVETIGEYSLMASDVISYLGGAFLHLTKD
jgi:NAD(P)H-hydrate epimerase